ncbi:hypothetical protein ABZT04_08765 [Streptomyces sp. NPDC005492]|uniref:hypothetical protein n=1 Tax=Streptomyces sp. NPDC005492 TaxID=3156883 RepID=UPI0033AEE3B2
MPTALARTGHLARAAESAYTIDDEFKQGTELLELVKAAASAGDLCGAQALAESIPLRQLRDQALVALVPAWARAGERDKAVALADRVRYPHNWGWAWALLAKEVADSGDIDEALRFAARAEDEVSSYPVEGTEQVLALLVEVAVTTGDHDRAAALADRLADFTRSRGATGWSQPRPLARVLAREVLAGDFDRLDALLRPAPRSGGMALEGDPGGDLEGDPEEDPDEVAARPFFPRSPLDAWDMACVLDAVAETAHQDLALVPALADRAEALLETGISRDHDILLRSVTLLLARHGQVDRAMALADRLDPDLSVARHAEIVGELARSGDTGRAETLAHAITDWRAQARALIEVVGELARRGETGQAEALVHSINDPWAQGEALVAVARETAWHGEPGRAETLTRSIVYRATRARALAALVEQSEQAVLSGQSHARRLAAQAVVLDGWAPVLPALERIAPRSVAVVADLMVSGSVAGDDVLPNRTSPRPPRP